MDGPRVPRPRRSARAAVAAVTAVSPGFLGTWRKLDGNCEGKTVPLASFGGFCAVLGGFVPSFRIARIWEEALWPFWSISELVLVIQVGLIAPFDKMARCEWDVTVWLGSLWLDGLVN